MVKPQGIKGEKIGPILILLPSAPWSKMPLPPEDAMGWLKSPENSYPVQENFSRCYWWIPSLGIIVLDPIKSRIVRSPSPAIAQKPWGFSKKKLQKTIKNHGPFPRESQKVVVELDRIYSFRIAIH